MNSDRHRQTILSINTGGKGVKRAPVEGVGRTCSALAGQRAGRTDACPVMEMVAEAIWLATTTVDMRTGIDGLSLHVQQALGRPLCDGTAYVFANRRSTRLKLLCWDGTGVWMCVRRLHRGQFTWQQADEASWQISAEQWQWLVAGVGWQGPPRSGPPFGHRLIQWTL